uniref:Uncharacterized protein n=1 Tax=Amphimedon queenslandica TaxID=400682 RepID=A0A1X7TN82_AMPQE
MPTSSTTFEQYHEAKLKVASFNDEILSLSSALEQAQQMLVLLLLTNPDPNRVQHVSQLITTNSQKIAALKNSISQQEKVMKKGFDK